jgi:hypothetical protein
MTTIAGFARVGFFINSAKTGGIESGPRTADAGAIERIRARQIETNLLTALIGLIRIELKQ